ncbi:YafY family transcriptional regulator [Shimazuella sp. AN120528]|nr:YafY family transcriptional regulator [Shimazuella soli]
MAKADNMLAILWLLISRHRMTASELAESLETSVRTIYRYIDSLCASGVPIIAESGHDGGYRLFNKFIETPLFFDTDERKALYYASLFAKQAGYPYEGSLENALQKIKYQMSEDQQKEFSNYTRGFDVVTPAIMKIDDQMLRTIEKAIASCNRLTLHYQKTGSNSPENRQVDPYGIVHWNRKWYLVGYCHLRGENRTFRLDRVEKLEIESFTFNRPENFIATDFFLSWLAPKQNQRNFVPLTIHGNKEAIQYLRHHWQLQYYFVHQTETEIQFLVERESLETYIPGFLFTYGTTIKVIEPISLKKSLTILAQNLTKHYQQD